MYRAQNGLLIPSVTNTPRVEYGSGGDCLGLLMEASRTNLCLQSQTLDNASWVKSNSSVTADAATAPDGTTTADKIVENGATAQHIAQQIGIAPLVAASVYCASVFVKADTRTKGRLLFIDSLQIDGVGVSYDLTAGTAAATAAFGAGTLTASGIIPYANGWYRVWVSGAMNNLKVAGGPYLNTRDAAGSDSYTGDTTSGFFAWGAQLELGAFPSSYIPTTTVSVARTADSCIRTLSTEFSATAGTVVVAGRASGGQDAAANQIPWDFNDTGTTNRIALFRNLGTDTAEFRITSAGVAQLGALTGTFVNSTTFKAASAWAVNDAAFSFNGGAVSTDNTVALPAVTPTVLGLGGNIPLSTMNGHIRSFDYFPQRLDNATLQSRST